MCTQELVPDRQASMVRDRWAKIVNPLICIAPWTSEEDQLLIQLVSKYGNGNWSKIANELTNPPRTAHQVRIRYERDIIDEDTISDLKSQRRKKRKLVPLKHSGKLRSMNSERFNINNIEFEYKLQPVEER